MIKDNGNRREFDSGAVRDCPEGKGRCDLMPLNVVAEIMEDDIIWYISRYQNDKDILALENALSFFAVYYSSVEEMMLEVSIHFEEGAKKYGEYNWQKGIPESSYIDSAVRHYLKFKAGHVDERHDRAFVWNILCLMWQSKQELSPEK